MITIFKSSNVSLKLTHTASSRLFGVKTDEDGLSCSQLSRSSKTYISGSVPPKNTSMYF